MGKGPYPSSCTDLRARIHERLGVLEEGGVSGGRLRLHQLRSPKRNSKGGRRIDHQPVMGRIFV